MNEPVRANLIGMLPRLRRLARFLCGQDALADDLVQAACLKALANEDSWTPGTRFDAWVFRILRNQWIDWTRQHGAGAASIDDAGDIAGDDGRRVTESALRLHEVQRGIYSLPPEQQQVLLLVCGEEMSYQEAADILGLPIGTVMSRLARARRRLLELADGDARLEKRDDDAAAE